MDPRPGGRACCSKVVETHPTGGLGIPKPHRVWVPGTTMLSCEECAFSGRGGDEFVRGAPRLCVPSGWVKRLLVAYVADVLASCRALTPLIPAQEAAPKVRLQLPTARGPGLEHLWTDR